MAGAGAVCMVENSSIPALCFGGIEGLIGGREQGFRAFASGGWVEDGRADAACNPELGLSSVDLQVGD